jgi:tetratricopeptide (TPR) repeat protein
MKRFKCLLLLFLGFVALPLSVWADSDEDARFLKENLEQEAPWARERADRIAREVSPATREKIALALLQAAKERDRLGLVVEDGWPAGFKIAFCNEILRRFDKDKNPVIQEVVAEVLTMKGALIRDCGSMQLARNSTWHICKSYPEAAATVFAEIERRFGKNTRPAIRAQYVQSLVEKGKIWAKDDPEKAIAIYDDVVLRFGEEKFPAIRAQVLHALRSKAQALLWPEHFLDESPNKQRIIATHDEIDRRFGKDDVPEIKQILLESLYDRMGSIRNAQARLAICDDINQRFGKNNAPFNMVRYKVSSGFFGGGGLSDDGVDVFALVEQRFGQRARELNQQGHLLQQQGNFDAALAIYDDITQRFGLFGSHFVAMSLVGKAETLERQGKVEAAMSVYNEVEQYYKRDLARQSLRERRIMKEFNQRTQEIVAEAIKARNRLSGQ